MGREGREGGSESGRRKARKFQRGIIKDGSD